MKKNFKICIGNLAIALGKHAVGKCMIPGMYDPEIPAALKEDKSKKQKENDRE